MKDYMTIKETAKLQKVSPRWVQTLCTNGKIDGALKFGNAWAIPKDAERPKDERIISGAYINWRKKSEDI